MSAPVVRRRLLISGRVQGVWFRATTRDAASDAGATGWVRNRPDGAVEAEVQGTVVAVGAVEAFCADGPPMAHVVAVDSKDVPIVAGETGFEVR